MTAVLTHQSICGDRITKCREQNTVFSTAATEYCVPIRFPLSHFSTLNRIESHCGEGCGDGGDPLRGSQSFLGERAMKAWGVPPIGRKWAWFQLWTWHMFNI